MKAVLPALARPMLEPHLPADLDVAWFASREDAIAMIADADIAWVDMQPARNTADVIAAGGRLQWVSTIYAGVDPFDLPALKAGGTVLTNGVGINAMAVAEYAVMGVLVAAKRFDQVVRQADTKQWTIVAPGTTELDGSRALIVGYGTIGKLIGDRLKAFGVEVTAVTRSGRDGSLTPDQWKPRIGEYDWVILAAPSTDDTQAMIGADELGAMKPSAWLVNIARGDMVDQDALIATLKARTIAGAFLDTVTPEPMPADHPLWDTPNAILTMHLSGRSQTTMYTRAATLFVENLRAFLNGGQMKNIVDLDAGY